MIDLSIEQIRSAQANELDAVTQVITAMEERIGQLATRHASKGGRVNPDLFEELEQIGRIECWEALSRFQGNTVAEFFAYMDRSISGKLGDARRSETRMGVPMQAAKDFETALSACGGDPYEAERYAQSEGMGPRKMSRENALAARLSWQGVEYLDAPAPGTEQTLGALLEESASYLPDEEIVPEDLKTDRDREQERRAVVKGRVHAALAKLGTQSAYVLRAMYPGLNGVYHGFDANADEEIAAVFGSTPAKVRVVRSKAKARFRELYLQGAQQTYTPAA